MRIEPEAKILTLGCGIGLLEIEIAKRVGKKGFIVATDASTLQLEIAVKHKELDSIHNLIFKKCDIAELEQISGHFDRVHCRFVLSHMPWPTIEMLLPLILSKVAPGGALVLEEVAKVESLSCEPYSEEYDLWKRYATMQFKMQGSHLSLGSQLQDHLKNLGCHFDFHSYQPILSGKREKTILSLGLLSLADGLIAKKAVSREEIFNAIERLKLLEENPDLSPRYCEVCQFFIQKR